MSTDPAFPYIQLCISSMALSNDVEFFPVWQQLGEKPAKNCLEHMQVKEQKEHKSLFRAGEPIHGGLQPLRSITTTSTISMTTT